MTPLDRYRKHYLMFDYWNGELIAALQSSSINPKRFKRSSTEALGELQTMKELLADDMAARLAPVIEARRKMDEELQSGDASLNGANAVVQRVEAQTRQIHREFFWRDVQDHLKQ